MTLTLVFVTTKHGMIVCGAMLAGLAGLRMARGADDDLDSLKVCKETQKLLFENSFVRVIDDVIAPGVAEPKHHHPHGLVITMADAEMETTAYPAAKAVRGHARFGAVSWNEGLVHEVRNVGTVTSHYIRIDLK